MLMAPTKLSICKNPISVLWSSNMSVGFRCTLLSNVVFWVVTILGLYADHLVATNQSKFLRQHKLQPNIIIDGSDRLQLIRLTAFNMLFVSCFTCCPLYEWVWNLLQPDGIRLTNENDDNYWTELWKSEICWKIPVHVLVAEVCFYTIHILLHSSQFLYHHIHKIHHRFPAPTAMCCVYAHPIEFAFGNVLPIYAGPMLTNAHPYTCYLWWCLAMLGTCKGHSGYRILGHVDDHEEHHLFFKHNYGGMGLLDRLLGTTPSSPATFKQSKT